MPNAIPDYNMHRYQDMDFWDESTSSSVLEETTDISAAYAENFTAGRVRCFAHAGNTHILTHFLLHSGRYRPRS